MILNFIVELPIRLVGRLAKRWSFVAAKVLLIAKSAPACVTARRALQARGPLQRNPRTRKRRLLHDLGRNTVQSGSTKTNLITVAD